MNTVILASGRVCPEIARAMTDSAISGLISQKHVRLALFCGEEDRKQAEEIVRTYRDARSLWPEGRAEGMFAAEVELQSFPLPDPTEQNAGALPEEEDRAAEHLARVLRSRQDDRAVTDWYRHLTGPEAVRVFREADRLLVIADLSDEKSLPGVGMMIRLSAEHTAARALLLSPDSPDPEKRMEQLRNGLDRLCALRVLPGGTGGTAGAAEAVLLVHMPVGCAGGWKLTERLAVAAALGRMDADPAAFGQPLTIPDSREGMLKDRRTVTERRAGATAIFLKTAVLPVIRKRLTERNPVLELKPRWWAHGLRRALREENPAVLLKRTEDLEKCLDRWLQHTASLIRETDVTLRVPDGTIWTNAVQAYGRLVTDQSELKTEEAEAKAAELERTLPVHRHSMADTEEERQLSQLRRLRQRVSEEEEELLALLPTLGGARFLEVLRDCGDKCGTALRKCEEHLRALSEASASGDESPEIRIEKKRAERRRSSLRAALDRVREDKQAWIRKGWWKTAAKSTTPTAPLRNILLEQTLLDMAVNGDRTDIPLKRFPGKDLSPATGCPSLSAMAEELERYSPSSVRELLEICAGICMPATGSADANEPAARNLILYPENSLWSERSEIPAPADLAERLPGTETGKDIGAPRGLLAVLLLWHDWRTENGTELTVECCRGGTSENVRLALKSRQCEAAWPVVLKRGNIETPLAVIFPGGEILLADADRAVAELLPERVLWIQRDTGAFLDPCAFLNDSDAVLLTRKLTVMRTARPDPRLSAFLQRFAVDISRGRNALKQRADAELSLRSAAVDTLLELSTGKGLMRTRREAYRAASVYVDPAVTALTGREIRMEAVRVPDRTVYLWRDFPFARTSGTDRLEPVLPLQEQATLEELASELQMVQQQTLEWPWQKDSPSYRAKVAEAFPDLNADLLTEPFADRFAMCFLPADTDPGVLEDSGLFVLPSAEGGNWKKAAFYPFSERLAAAIDTDPVLKRAVRSDSMGVVTQRDGSARAVVVLHGIRDLTLTRVYTPEEQERLENRDLPRVDCWPAHRYPENQWRTYRLYIRNHTRFTFGLPGKPPEKNDSPFVFADGSESAFIPVRRMPDCIPVRLDGNGIGCLYRYETRPIDPKRHAILCVDPGEAGTSVLMDLEGQILCPALGEKRHVLLPGGPGPARSDSDSATGILPSVVRLYQNSGEGALRGDAGTDADTDPRLLYSHMKWRPGDEAREAEKIWLKETMLRALLAARSGGAADIRWRFTLPEGMTEIRTEAYRRTVTDLADQLSAETGVPFTDGVEKVTFYREGELLKRYFTLLAPEERACLLMDTGHSGTNITAWTRGSETPAAVIRVPLGTQFMFMRPALEHPELLEKDFAALEDPGQREKLALVLKRAEEIGNEPWRLYTFSLALEALLKPDSGVIVWMDRQAMQGRATLLHSLLLLNSCFLMALCASVTDQLAEDPRINDLLPRQLTICLAGRGSLLPELLAPAARERIRAFARMNLSASVHVPEIRVMLTRDPKQELTLAMCRAASPGQTAEPPEPEPRAASPLVWIGTFLNEFRDAFPDATEYLFPGLFTGEIRDADQLMEDLIRDAFSEPETSFQAGLCAILDQLLKACGT